MTAEKRPRHYAAEILNLSTREARAAALNRVPAEYQEWVKTLVKNEFDRRRKRT